MIRLRNEQGFALPFTIFLVTLMTIMLAAAFTRASSETLIANSSESAVTALSIARSGLRSFTSDDLGTAPTSGDSVRYNVPGGYAWVRADLLQNPAGPTGDMIYVLRSRGTLIDPAQGSTPMAVRSVAQFATWQSSTLAPMAAWTAAAGAAWEGGVPGNVDLWGNDGDATCNSGQSIPSLVVPIDPLNDYAGSHENGDPQIEGGTPASVALAAGVDWSKITSGGFEADFDAIQPFDGSYSTTLVDGDAVLGPGLFLGTGLLIVTGDLDVAAIWGQWRGVVLVGGQIRFRPGFLGNTFYGTVMSGLNETLGVDEPPSLMGLGGPLDIVHSPCRIAQALEAVRGFRELRNTSVDNWAEY